jgi:hypothetical protein
MAYSDVREITSGLQSFPAGRMVGIRSGPEAESMARSQISHDRPKVGQGTPSHCASGQHRVKSTFNG